MKQRLTEINFVMKTTYILHRTDIYNFMFIRKIIRLKQIKDFSISYTFAKSKLFSINSVINVLGKICKEIFKK